jgi:predicted aspartyl protease
VARNLFPPGSLDPKDLENYGPRLEIEVGPPMIRSQKAGWLNTGNGKSSRMPAMVDTGAARTVLTPLAIETVGLSVVDYTRVTRAGGTENRVSVHAASIRFPRYQITAIEVIQILCCELPEQPIQCLIGRDIISRWLFTYNGKSGQWTIDEEEVGRWVEPPEEFLTNAEDRRHALVKCRLVCRREGLVATWDPMPMYMFLTMCVSCPKLYPRSAGYCSAARSSRG